MTLIAHGKEFSTLKENEKIISDRTNDFGDIMIMALRYALGRRTYVTSEVPDFIQENERAVLDKSNFIIQNEEEMNPRVCSVMLKDLKEYISDRNKGLIQDDECDYKSWLNLYQWLIALDTRQGWGVYKNER